MGGRDIKQSPGYGTMARNSRHRSLWTVESSVFKLGGIYGSGSFWVGAALESKRCLKTLGLQSFASRPSEIFSHAGRLGKKEPHQLVVRKKTNQDRPRLGLTQAHD
jgi:hypothetical protein